MHALDSRSPLSFGIGENANEGVLETSSEDILTQYCGVLMVPMCLVSRPIQWPVSVNSFDIYSRGGNPLKNDPRPSIPFASFLVYVFPGRCSIGAGFLTRKWVSTVFILRCLHPSLRLVPTLRKARKLIRPTEPEHEPSLVPLNEMKENPGG